ncbi:gastrula zinc finger protein xFG20-1-like isoform X1 [Agrilus planipennis]|uniref:Gastrula zinc finger protein xFG20-1-like isoform X1 n=1 Tax=Agrilus planipennis TaxID=224129 RepID=A0A1W4XJW2_AGRPL|nr:gastrula zinc finger protein xFG20-1-like isoform X1 [Agrilus planipennis]
MNKNDNILKECSICLKSDSCLLRAVDVDSNNLSYSIKLSFCVPEVEWNDDSICNNCALLLDQAYEFKELCLKSKEVISYQVTTEQSLENEKIGVRNEGEALQHSEDDYSVNSDQDRDQEVDHKYPYRHSSKVKKLNVQQVPSLSEFVCKICNETFKDRKLLAVHNKSKHGMDKPYNCLFCDRQFKRSADIYRHELIHLNQRSFTCEICNQSYNTPSILSSHMIIKHADSSKWKYVCSHCNKKFPFKSNRDTHIRRHHTNATSSYTCYHCGESYTSRILLINHIRSKHTLKSQHTRKCQICASIFINQLKLENHMRKEHGLETGMLKKRMKRYSCEKCGRKYTTERVLRMHVPTCDGIKRHSNTMRQFRLKKDDDSQPDSDIKTENTGMSLDNNKSLSSQQDLKRKHKRTDLTCEICNVFVGPYKKLAAHTLKDHGVDAKTLKPYHCDECDAKFSSSTHLARHKLYHAGNRTHMCSYCGKGFITKKDMITHEKLHSNTRDIQCELCSKSFNTKTHLRTHKLVVHTDPSQWNHICPYCGKRFPMKSNYDQHVRRHTGEKPFGCHLCDKRFSDKFVLQQHFNTHSNIRAFKCTHCEKEYKNNRVLEIHLKKVHGIGNAKIPVRVKKFFCEHCPKAFAAKDKLQRHMYSHTGERPFSCNICDKKFTDKWYVKQHLTVHNLIKSEPNECLF